jgi:hypothetical protein
MLMLQKAYRFGLAMSCIIFQSEFMNIDVIYIKKLRVGTHTARITCKVVLIFDKQLNVRVFSDKSARFLHFLGV